MLQDPKQITELEGVCNGFAVFGVGQRPNRKYGLIDHVGNVVVEPEYCWVSYKKQIDSRYIEFHTKEFWFSKRSKRHPRYFDLQRREWVNIDQRRRHWPMFGSDGQYFMTYAQHRVGVADRTGRQIVPEKYAYIGLCYDNFIVRDPESGRFGILTPEGEELVPTVLQYEKVYSKGAGRSSIGKQDGAWFYIDKLGEVISKREMPDLPADVKHVWFESEYTIYYVELFNGDYRSGVLDGNGRTIIPPIYSGVDRFNAKYFKTYNDDYIFDNNCYYLNSKCPFSKQGLKNQKGDTVIPSGEYVVRPIAADDDLVVMRRGDLVNADCGVIRIEENGSLTEVIPVRYHIFPAAYFDLIAAAPWKIEHGSKITGHYGIFSLTGEQLVPFEYDFIDLGNDPDRIAVSKSGEWFFINLKNERILF